MRYHIRHPGPSISTIWWSDRLIGQRLTAVMEAEARAWDHLCDADPALVPWFLSSLDARRGETMWKVDDHLGPPKVRRTKAGDLTVYISVDELFVADAVPVLQQLTMWTLTMRAELDGFDPPPDALARLSQV